MITIKLPPHFKQSLFLTQSPSTESYIFYIRPCYFVYARYYCWSPGSVGLNNASFYQNAVSTFACPRSRCRRLTTFPRNRILAVVIKSHSLCLFVDVEFELRLLLKEQEMRRCTPRFASRCRHNVVKCVFVTSN